jgi:hypothetical protein
MTIHGISPWQGMPDTGWGKNRRGIVHGAGRQRRWPWWPRNERGSGSGEAVDRVAAERIYDVYPRLFEEARPFSPQDGTADANGGLEARAGFGDKMIRWARVTLRNATL